MIAVCDMGPLHYLILIERDGMGIRSNSWKGTTAMASLTAHESGDVGLVFVVHNNHDERCGTPPRLRNIDHPGRYYGYFENRYGERFVFTFDRETKTGTVSGGDLGWGEAQIVHARTAGRGFPQHKEHRRADRMGGVHRGIEAAGDRHRAGAGSPHGTDGQGRDHLAPGLPAGLCSPGETARLSAVRIRAFPP
jgi:hypothetical protein